MKKPNRIVQMRLNDLRGCDGPAYQATWVGGPRCGHGAWIHSPPALGDRQGLFFSATDKRRHEWEFKGVETDDGEFVFDYVGVVE